MEQVGEANETIQSKLRRELSPRPILVEDDEPKSFSGKRRSISPVGPKLHREDRSISYFNPRYGPKLQREDRSISSACPTLYREDIPGPMLQHKDRSISSADPKLYREDRSTSAVAWKADRKLMFGFQARRAVGHQMTGVTAESLPHLIDRIGFGRGQFVTFMILMGYPISEGSELISMMGISKSLKDDWHLTDFETGLLVSWSIAGMFAGTIYAGKLADVRGRRFAILLSYFAMSMSAGCVMFANGFWSMSFLRFWGGFASALGVPAAISMIIEMSPSDWRPILFAVYALMVVVGQIFACIGFCIWMPLLGSDDPHAWRVVADWCSLPSFFFLVLSVVQMQESAHWLLIEGRVDEAQRVLMDMAIKNDHAEIAKEIVAIAGKPSASKEKQEAWRDHYHREFELLWKHAEFRVTLVCFVVLCYVVHLTTFGMDCLWPRLMMEETQQFHHERYAALELTGLQAAGLFSCILTYGLLSTGLGVKLGNRLVIMISGFISAVFVAILAIQRIAMLEGQFFIICSLSMIFANILYAATLEFLAESFPTEVRGTANGLCIGMGRLASMAAPLILAACDATALLVAIALSLFPGTCAAFPLKEHHGEALEDYIGDDEEDSDISSIADRASEESEAESEEEDYDSIFGKATLGARVELLIMIAGIGTLQGLAACYYLSSGGYFVNSTKSTATFTFQVISLFGAAFITLCILWSSTYFDTIEMDWTLLVRVVFGGAILGIMVFSTALIDTTEQLICIGCVIGVLGAAILACSVDIAAKIHPRALTWVYAGLALGAFEVQGTDRLIGFGPGSRIEFRLIYFGIGLLCCGLLAVCYWFFPGPITRFDEFWALSEWRTTPRGLSTPRTPRTLRTQMSIEHLLLLALAYINVAIWNISTYFLVTQVPFFGKPAATQMLYFCQVVGDCFGRFIAVGLLGVEDSQPCTRADKDADEDVSEADDLIEANRIGNGAWRQIALVTVGGFAGTAISVIAALPLAFPHNAGLQSLRLEEHSLKLGIFASCCLCALAESSQVVIVPLAMPKPSRQSIVRKHVVLRFAAIAVAAALAIYLFQFQNTDLNNSETANESTSTETGVGSHSYVQLEHISTRSQKAAQTFLKTKLVQGHYPFLRDEKHRRPLTRTAGSLHFPARLDVQIALWRSNV